MVLLPVRRRRRGPRAIRVRFVRIVGRPGCLGAFTGAAPVQVDGDDGDHDQHEHPDGGTADNVFHLPVGGAGQVAEQDEPRTPQQPAGGVERKEPAVMHAGHPGQPRHHRKEERGEPEQKDRAATLVPQVLLRLIEGMPAGPKQSQVQQAGAEMAADLVATESPMIAAATTSAIIPGSDTARS